MITSDNKNILLTGGSGLLGSHILLKLLEQGYQVKCLVRNEEACLIAIEELSNWYKIDFSTIIQRISFAIGDINELDSIENALIGINYVIHAAAMVSTDATLKGAMLKVNAEGTANIVNACLYNKIEKLIYISSVATLGPNPDDLVDEDYFFKQSPNTSAYALSKYAAEQEVWRGAEEGLDVLILNPAFIIGPSKKLNSSAAIFYALKAGLPGYLSGKSGYVDVRDVANAVALCLSSEIKSQRFILCARNFKTNIFLNMAAASLGVKAPTWEVPNYLLPFIVIGSKLKSVIAKSSIPLTWDGIKMAQSFNAFDGRRFQTFFPKFQYRPIEESLENTSAFIRNSSV